MKEGDRVSVCDGAREREGEGGERRGGVCLLPLAWRGGEREGERERGRIGGGRMNG